MNALNQYSAVGAVTPTYDGNGNLTYDGAFTYCYDTESRLIGVLSSGSCASPGVSVASYAYDARGRRKSKTVGGVTTMYVTGVNDNEVLEYDGATGAVGNWYVYGLGVDAVLSQVNAGAGARQTMIPDVQGSIIATLDAASGVVSKAGYLSFGENPTTYTGSFRYTGRRIDPETGGSPSQPSGLYYYRARTYSPTWGRFLQPDPIGYAGGGNLYAYTDNDPLNQTDPSGRCPWCVGAVVGFAVDFAAQAYTAHANGQSVFQTYDWRQGLAATAIGAATAGVSALAGGAIEGAGVVAFAGRTAVNTAIGTAGSVAQTAVLNNFDNQNGSYVAAAEWGAGFSSAGSVAADAVTGLSSAINQAKFNQLSPGEQNLANGIANLSGYQIGGPSPGANAAAAIGGALISGGSAFAPTDSGAQGGTSPK